MNHVPFEGGDAELFRKMRRDGGSHPEKIDESSPQPHQTSSDPGNYFWCHVEKTGLGRASIPPPIGRTGLGGGGEWGAIMRAHQKKDFGAIPYFL